MSQEMTDTQNQRSRIVNAPEQWTDNETNETKKEENPYELPQIKATCQPPEKILKVVFAGFLFLAVIGSGFVARISLHILLWHLNPPHSNADNRINTLGGLLTKSCPSNNSFSNVRIQELRTIDEKWIWAVFLVIVAPYMFTFVSTLMRTIFKSNKPIQWRVFLVVLLFETIHAVGISIMAFLVLPSFDPASASVVYLAVMAAPPFLDLIDKVIGERTGRGNGGKSCWNETSVLSCFVALFGLALQIAGIILISLYTKDKTLISLFVVGSLCVSCKHWDNFIRMGSTNSGYLREIKLEFQVGRTKITCLVNLIKILITFLAVIFVYISRGDDTTSVFRSLFNYGTSTFNTFFGDAEIGSDVTCQAHIPFIIAIISIVCDYVCYKGVKTSCVINCQRFGLGIPVAIIPVATTLSLGGLMFKPYVLKYGSCDLLFSDWCLKSLEMLGNNCQPLVIAFPLLYMSFLVINRHVWKVDGARQGETARIFVSPFYCGVFLDLSLFLNRRRQDKEYNVVFGKDTKTDEPKETTKPIKLYACCATMWHETANEMTQLLKSIYRLDKRQKINKIIAEGKEKGDQESNDDVQTFDLEAHIFFDDAFEPLKEGEKYPEVNEYVREFIRVIEIAGSVVHGKQIELPDGNMFRTPYGGRIEWVLPAGNILIVHLKDKNKIRHKKRWSQVMYMFYILKWKLLANTGKDGLYEAAENSYLLALDGDVDFEPEAVLSLVRRMKKSPLVGAACGRIHPIGSGPMVWYQKFEYAVSHWLQKATEHVIGCVLCSPGCFSLFRGSAILQAKVLETYTTVATEAQDYVQYDQGEDRWLCTLLLKQGWKIEYCAESDSYTFAPEGFYEFFNQRRRWTPSTMANILDLILDWQQVTKNNENISILYIVYHVFLFVSTLLTPGTIFMIILGAIILGFPAIPPWLSLVLNLVPVGVFLLMCLYTTTQRQLQFAAILSVIYAIVMVIVLIGVIRDASEEGICSMTTIFLLFVASVFVISALLHPKEIGCIFPGLLYFIAIPSMSMLLFLYSIGNLHVVSWGTRETKQTTETKKEKKTFVPEREEKGYFFSFGKFVSCICCPTNTYSKEDFIYKNMLEQMKTLYPKSDNLPNRENHAESDNLPKPESKGATNTEDSLDKPDILQDHASKEKATDKKKGSDDIHYFFNENVPRIPKDEGKFWKKTIKRYLEPLEKNEEKEKEIQEQLIDLRNRVCLFVYLLNAILVTVMFGLTQVNTFKSSLTITFPCMGDDIQIVPISVLFSVVFGLLLFLQFICMLYHRFSTLIHIAAETNIIDSQENKDNAELLNIAEFLTTPAIAQPQHDTSVSDKNRTFLDKNRTLILPEHTKPVHRLDDVVRQQMGRLKNLEGSLYGKRKMLINSVLTKWRPGTQRVTNTGESNRPKLRNVADQLMAQKSKISNLPNNKVEPEMNVQDRQPSKPTTSRQDSNTSNDAESITDDHVVTKGSNYDIC